MNILSWNCRGLGKPRTVRALNDLVRDRRPEVLFLIETISDNKRIEELRIKFGYSNCFSVDRRGRSGGLALFWNSRWEGKIFGYSNNHIDIIFEENGIEAWRLSCFYGFPERSRRKESWNFLRALSKLSVLPWCVIGDFNDLLYSTDKKGVHEHPNALLEGFKSAVEGSGLVEVELCGGNFTWEKSRGSKNWVEEKLDRAFATSNWWTKFPLCKLNLIDVPVSDHNPIFLVLVDITISRRVFRFRFENMWLQEPSFAKETAEYWKKIPVMHLIPKLKEVSRFMGKWGRTFFNKFKEKLRVQKETLDKLKGRVDEAGVKEYMVEREKLNDILLQEETYWKQRAKLFWLREGDENTRFFHSSASARKKANHIHHLLDETGAKIEDNEGMGNIVKDYFKNIFTRADTGRVLDRGNSPRVITEDQNKHLMEEMTFEEFTVAINQMHPDKSSGPDGLNPAFYQNFWKTMGMEIYHCCKKWLQGDPFPADLNSTNVVLIPKIDNAVTMKDFRPIALCNVLYKIMAKVLANRIKEVLPGVIAENQSAFVAGRNITDNFLVAFEIIHHMRNKKGGQEGEIALKLDVSKAYDRVDWSYLQQRMRSMGFCEGWIRWMMRCVTTVIYEFCFNGMTVGPIIPGRGLRQGDPLSPYLFLMCVEGLSNNLDRAAERGEITGCRISATAPEVTHLLFADDSFLFFKAQVNEVLKIKTILEEYAIQSGQAINFQKSGIFYSSNVRRDKQLEFSELLGVYNDITKSNYLGLPAMIGRSKKRTFGFIKERVSRRLQTWSAKPISRAGKTVLLKNAAQSIPSYCMMCFLLPKGLCQDIEKMFNTYWWKSGKDLRRGIYWHSWEAMSMTKGRGGLGFRSLHGFNVALLGKQVWRCLNFPDLLASRVLKARYFADSSMLNAAKGSNSSSVWGGDLASQGDVERWF